MRQEPSPCRGRSEGWWLIRFHRECAENLDLKLSTSKILGKPNDGKTNPEEMFSGGFAGEHSSMSSSISSVPLIPIDFPLL